MKRKIDDFLEILAIILMFGFLIGGALWSGYLAWQFFFGG